MSTDNARLEASDSCEGATKREGCSAQYAGNSVNEVVDRMKGGAVKEERSPLNVAIVCHRLDISKWFHVASLDQTHQCQEADVARRTLIKDRNSFFMPFGKSPGFWSFHLSATAAAMLYGLGTITL